MLSSMVVGRVADDEDFDEQLDPFATVTKTLSP
jgi:hypothetical protein